MSVLTCAGPAVGRAKPQPRLIGTPVVTVDRVNGMGQTVVTLQNGSTKPLTYVTLRDVTTNEKMLRGLIAHESELLELLQRDSIDALQSARLLLKQMRDGVYPEQLREAVTSEPPTAWVRMDPAFAYERQPLTFRVEFAAPDLDSAAAREAWTIEWQFGDDLSERGGSVSHYFLLPRTAGFQPRRPRTFRVVATILDGNGRWLVNGAGERIKLDNDITIHPRTAWEVLGERTVTEGVRLAAALLIAVFALVAGAREQLLKLDVLPGLVAVFLVGFGADSIKNLLTSK